MREPREITGRHVALIFGAAFAVIITVNLVLAYSAVSTFPGLEVQNSYAASQAFDENRAAQEALGWTVTVEAKEGFVALSLKDAKGRPVEAAALEATIGRATHVREDQTPEFTFDGRQYLAAAVLEAGRWNVRLVAQAADGTVFRQRVLLRVPKENS